MDDVSPGTALGGALGTLLTLLLAAGEVIKRRKTKKLVDADRAEPTEVTIARVENYARAEADLRIQLAQRDWELRDLVAKLQLERQAHQLTLSRLEAQTDRTHALHAELAELRAQIAGSATTRLPLTSERTHGPIRPARPDRGPRDRVDGRPRVRGEEAAPARARAAEDPEDRQADGRRDQGKR